MLRMALLPSLMSMSTKSSDRALRAGYKWMSQVNVGLCEERVSFSGSLPDIFVCTVLEMEPQFRDFAIHLFSCMKLVPKPQTLGCVEGTLQTGAVNATPMLRSSMQLCRLKRFVGL